MTDALTFEDRKKRLRLRSWRRGAKEMDLMLGGYVDAVLEDLDEERLAALEKLILLEDPQLYAWLSAAMETPAEHQALITAIRAHHGATA